MKEPENDQDVVLVRVKPRQCIREGRNLYFYPDEFETTRERSRSLEVDIVEVVKRFKPTRSSSSLSAEDKAKLVAIVEKGAHAAAQATSA